MAVIAGRGAQAQLSGAAQLAARGASATDLLTNTAARDALVAAGTAPAGNTVDGTTSTGAVPIQTFDFDGTATDSITAKASGTHATGVQLTAPVNNITACATTKDSVILPPMVPGQMVSITNNGTASAQVFASGTGTINGVATDTGVALAAGKTGVYFATTASKINGGALA